MTARHAARLLGVGALLLAFTGAAAAREWEVDYAQSELVFVSKQMNVPVDGVFKRFTAMIRFDPECPADGRARIDIDMNSIATGTDDGDEEVKRKLWLDVATYPSASFESTAVTRLGANRYAAAGSLTIKGITRNATLPFETKALAGGALQLAGAYTMKRLEFKIGGGVWSDTEVVADEVQLRYRLLLRP